MQAAAPSSSALQQGLTFLADIVRARLSQFLHPDQPVQFPDLHFQHDGSRLAVFVTEQSLSIEEYLLVFTALAPHLQPNFFGSLISEQIPAGTEMPEFGGVKPNHLRAMLPTGETALFILAGTGLSERLRCAALLNEGHWLFQQKILSLSPAVGGEPMHSGQLGIARDWLERFTQGTVSLPKLSTQFPAEHIVTDLDWSDLVLNEHALSQLQDIRIWVEHNATLMQDWGMKARLKPGYRALFYGPPGTGKTLAAMLLGKYTGREVFRVDLATMVSKYIGETEKNLASLFDQAEHRGWILFFDEADAIFGKRTQVRDAHDKYANQEVSYLLQRMESFSGMVILASNFRANLDDAFVRRFQSIIYFPAPRAAERFVLWKKALPPKLKLDKRTDLGQIAADHELTGAQITNIIHYVCLRALHLKTSKVNTEMLVHGIRRELAKDGK